MLVEIVFVILLRLPVLGNAEVVEEVEHGMLEEVERICSGEGFVLVLVRLLDVSTQRMKE